MPSQQELHNFLGRILITTSVKFKTTPNSSRPVPFRSKDFAPRKSFSVFFYFILAKHNATDGLLLIYRLVAKSHPTTINTIHTSTMAKRTLCQVHVHPCRQCRLQGLLAPTPGRTIGRVSASRALRTSHGAYQGAGCGGAGGMVESSWSDSSSEMVCHFTSSSSDGTP